MNKNDSFLKKNKKAFTLVEVVIVLAITVIVLAIMYEFLTESKKAMVSNEVNSTLQSEADNIQSDLVKFGTQSKKILSINGLPVDSSWLYSTKLDANNQYNGDINNIQLEFYSVNGTTNICEIIYDDGSDTLTLIEPTPETGTARTKVLSTHVNEFKIKPLDAVSNAGGNLSTTTGIQFVIELKMKKGYTDVKCPVNVNAKFRNKDVV